MSKALSVIPGLTTSFQFPVQMRFNELMTGARQDVVCKIYGKTLTASLPMPKTWKHHQYGKRSTGSLYRAC
jgi:Cu/Ag efflux pump CusA